MVDEPSGLVARVIEELDGTLVWVPRQGDTLPLAALERLREAHGAGRVVVELAPGARVVPLVGAPLTLPATTWDRAQEDALERAGLTPTMHAQAPSHLELLPADGAAHAGDCAEARALADGVDVVALDALAARDPDDDVVTTTVAASFGALGMTGAARWAAAIGRAFVGQGAFARVYADDDRGDGGALTGAALGVVHDGVMHVPLVTARRTVDLARLACALGVGAGLPVAAPGTGIAALDGGARLELPPALRWKRPRWAEHLADLDGIQDAVGVVAGADVFASPPALVARFALREHPLATWGGATIGQAIGRTPQWTQTAMLYREAADDAAHGVVPHAPRIDLASLAALIARHDLLWIGWEPPPDGGVVVDRAGVAHALRWDDPARALDEAAALGLFPVRARWTPRKRLVCDLAAPAPPLFAAPAPAAPLTLSHAPLAAWTLADWRRFDALCDGAPPDDLLRTSQPMPRRAARALALGHPDSAWVCIAAPPDGEAARAPLGALVVLVHDRVAWLFAGASHAAAPAGTDRALLAYAASFARERGCDLLDLGGVWDERHPDEHTSWRERSDALSPIASAAVYYPPTLALFRALGPSD